MWPLLLACALLLLPAHALAGAREKLAALAPSGLVLVMDEKGNELVAQNADKPFVPASVAKVVTAWLALEVLGADYRFETRFYLDGDRVLYIRGGGDPFLISEELAQLASALVAAIGKQPLSGIVLDASYYPSDIRIPGIEDTDEAYDALNSALAVNFNTIHAVRKGKTVRSAEEQPGEDLRKGARLAVNVDRLQALGHVSGRDLAPEAAADPLDECGDQLARILQAHRGVLG